MTELEKLDAGLEYDFWDNEVNGRKLRAIHMCEKLNAMPQDDEAAREPVIRELFVHAGENVSIGTNFNCDYGLHISVGKNFLTNYNVTILDIAPVTIGDYVMIGPNTLITTVGHPLTPMGRRKHLGISKPVTIGDDVWIGGNVTILPGVTIGNNVVIAAGAVVTRDVPDNCVAGGVPARVLRALENDIPENAQTNALGGMSPEAALEYMKNTPDLVIVQVNTAEWRIMPGFKDALWIPHDEMEERYGEIPAGRPVLLHCGGGIVSVPAYETLLEKRPDIPELGYIAGSPHAIMGKYNEWMEKQ